MTKRKQSKEWIEKRVNSRKQNNNYSSKFKGKSFPTTRSSEWLYNVSHHSQEHNEKNSIGLKKFWSSNEGIELKKKLSIERIGKPRTPEIMETLRLSNIGKKHTTEHNKKKGRVGHIAHNKGKRHPNTSIKIFFEHLEQRYTRKQQRSDNHKGIRNSMYGKKRPEISILMSKLAATRKFPYRNSKPERIMQFTLSMNGIKFEKHKIISTERGFYHCVDIFINPNICIEVDGKYFHSKPKQAQRDIIVNHELTIAGYHVLRIWDTDLISKSINVNNFLNLIREKMEIIKS